MTSVSLSFFCRGLLPLKSAEQKDRLVSGPGGRPEADGEELLEPEAAQKQTKSLLESLFNNTYFQFILPWTPMKSARHSPLFLCLSLGLFACLCQVFVATTRFNVLDQSKTEFEQLWNEQKDKLQEHLLLPSHTLATEVLVTGLMFDHI